ncbi:anti-sigma factor [Pedobacter psychroterrae]|uniref:Anti-sigma factor n=1 Tax=Pedobacter psychroterrae TaxID=2530453 RepID=A0A4V2MLW0_9SPHI|nr:anti-sigma factor [Pedobacter psychroterrae]TCD03597.1 anti-sigma factor [Pedobacter psychroterrae]
MEEVKAYIESGILELYVLGQLAPNERVEVEAMAAKYPEVKQEITAIEIAMEQYALAQALQPTEGLDKEIFNRIENTQAGSDHTESVTIPFKIADDAKQYESKIKTLRFALVACIALLVVSTVALYSSHTELGAAKEQIADLSSEKDQFTSTVNYMKQTNSDLQKIADMVDDPDWKTVRLAGTAMDPKAKMTVYWHIKGNHVMVDNSKMKLPANDDAHQYQLWALVNGKPVDLGVFDVKPDTTGILVNMKNIAAAQTFAVTLEKRGGSPSPTMDQMIVAGNVSI